MRLARREARLIPIIAFAGPAAATAAAVYSVTSGGSGVLSTGRADYPLGPLTYTVSSSGRGMLELRAGGGRVILSGDDAAHPEPMRWVLEVDLLQATTLRRVRGSCDLRLSADGATYRSLTCRGAMSPMNAPFTLRWKGDGVPVRAAQP